MATKNIWQKLLKVQEQVKALEKNKDGAGYKYVTGDKVLEFLRPIWTSEGLILKQEILSIDNERQDYTVGFGTPRERTKSEILSKVMQKFTWVDSDTGEKDENMFGANGQNDWDKGVGSALTYAERYFLLKYFHIATDEDDIDNPDRKPDEKEPAEKNTIKPGQKELTPAQKAKIDEVKKKAADELPLFDKNNKDEWDKTVKYMQSGGAMTALLTKKRISKEDQDELLKHFVPKQPTENAGNKV